MAENIPLMQEEGAPTPLTPEERAKLDQIDNQPREATPEQIAEAQRNLGAQPATPEQIAEAQKNSGQPQEIDPLRDLSAEDLAKLEISDPENFSIVGTYLHRPDLIGNNDVIQKAIQAHNLVKARHETNLSTEAGGDPAEAALLQLGARTVGAAKAIGETAKNVNPIKASKDFLVGLGKYLVNATKGAASPMVDDPEAQARYQRAAAENLAASELALTSLKGGMETAGKKIGQFTGILKPYNQYDQHEKTDDFYADLAKQAKLERVVTGKGPVTSAMVEQIPTKTGEIKPTVGADFAGEGGFSIRPEEVSKLAAGDPFTLYAFGKGLGMTGGFMPPALHKIASTGAAWTGDVAAKTAGTALEGIGAATDRVVKMIPGGKRLGEMIGAHVGGVPGVVVGESLGESAEKVLEKTIRKKGGLSGIGSQARTGEITAPSAQLLTDLAQSIPSIGADVAAGAGFDLATAAVMADTPEEERGTGIGTAFGILGAGRHVIGHATSGQLIAPRVWGGKTPVPTSPEMKNSPLGIMHDAAYAKAPPAIKQRINAVRSWMKKATPGVELIYAPDAPTLAKALIDSGRSPEDAAFHAAQFGFSGEINGKKVNVVVDPSAAPHEAFHPFQDVLGAEANDALNARIRAQYTPEEFEREAQRYAARLGWDGTGDWRDFINTASGKARAEAIEKTRQEAANTVRVREGREPTPDEANAEFNSAWKSAREEALFKAMQDKGGSLTDQEIATVDRTMWDSVLTEPEKKAAAERYASNELAAESWDALFKHTGETLQDPRGVLPMLARIVANVQTFLGKEPFRGRVSEVGQLPLKREVVKAIRDAVRAKTTEPPFPYAQNKGKGFGGVGPTPIPPKPGPAGPPGSPEDEAGKTAGFAETASDVPPEAEAMSPKEVLGTLAQAKASGQGVKITRLSVPGEPAGTAAGPIGAIKGVDRTVRRAKIEAWRNVPDEFKPLWEKNFAPVQTIQTSGGVLQEWGYSPEVFAANAHKVAGFLVDHPEIASPYPLDPATRSFTAEGWKSLYDDLQNFVANQKAGLTGAGGELVVPKEAKDLGMFEPARRGAPGEELSKEKGDFINYLYGFPLPGKAGEPVVKKQGKLSYGAQLVSEATEPGRTTDLIEPREFGGKQAERLGFAGEQVKEVNPFRAEVERVAAASGDIAPSLIEAGQRLNIADIKKVEITPEQPAFGGNTLTLKAGFQPQPENPSAIKTAAVRDQDGKIFEGTWHGDAALRAQQASGERGFLQHGFVTNEGEFLDRNQSLERALQMKQIPTTVKGEELETTYFNRQKGHQFQPKPQKGFVGYVSDEDNSIVAKFGDLSKLKHSDLKSPTNFISTWRYVPDLKTVFWWWGPDSPAQKEAVTNYLEEKGYEVTRHAIIADADNFDKAHGTRRQFQPIPEQEKKEIDLVGPDGKTYKARFDGYWDLSALGKGLVPSITALEDLPGSFTKGSTGMGPSIEKAGYTLPELPKPTEFQPQPEKKGVMIPKFVGPEVEGEMTAGPQPMFSFKDEHEQFKSRYAEFLEKVKGFSRLEAFDEANKIADLRRPKLGPGEIEFQPPPEEFYKSQNAGDSNDPEEIKKFAADDSWLVRMSAVDNPNFPKELLPKLAEDENPFVRAAVAENPGTPADVLKSLADDEDPQVQMAVAGNVNTPETSLNSLAKKSNNTTVLSTLLDNPNISDEALQTLSNFGGEHSTIQATSYIIGKSIRLLRARNAEGGEFSTAFQPPPEYEREKIRGGKITQPMPTYRGATTTKENPWVRGVSAKEPDNSGRVLLVQVSDQLLNPRTAAPDQATQYYNKLYGGVRPGYERPDDFWEIPQWMGFASHTFPNADVYVVRDVGQAKQFLNEAGYGKVLFSALNVNKGIIKDIAKGYNGQVDVGGYVDPKDFADTANIKWHPDLESIARDAGVQYKEGVDYRHFAGSSDTIPRLTMSTGCTYKCAFCDVVRQVKETPVQTINQQADEIAKFGSKLVYLNDKTFGQSKNYAQLPEVYQRIKAANPNFKGFVVQTTASQLLKIPGDFFSKAGIKFVELGIETYNDPILRDIKKPATEAQMQKAMDALREQGVAVIPNIIVGFPGETPETYGRTLDFLKKNKDVISHANIYNLAVYGDTELAKQVATLGENDFNENVLEKSFHTNPEVHKTFAGELYGLASQMLERPVQFQPKEGEKEEPKRGIPTFKATGGNEPGGAALMMNFKDVTLGGDDARRYGQFLIDQGYTVEESREILKRVRRGLPRIDKSTQFQPKPPEDDGVERIENAPRTFHISSGEEKLTVATTPEEAKNIEPAFAARLTKGETTIDAYPQYGKVSNEIDKHLGQVHPEGDVLVIGTGPFPLSQILLSEKLGRPVDGLELDRGAALLARQVMAKENAQGNVFVGNAAKSDILKNYKTIYVALDKGLPKETIDQIKKNLLKRMPDDSRLIVNEVSEFGGVSEELKQTLGNEEPIFDLSPQGPTTGVQVSEEQRQKEKQQEQLVEPKTPEPADVGLIGPVDERETQFQPKPKEKDQREKDKEAKMIIPPHGDASKAWILPSGKIEQLGAMGHHQWLEENQARFPGLKIPPFEGGDTEGVREQAIRKGFVRVNLEPNTGQLTIEGRAKDWRYQQVPVERLIEKNLNNIDKVTVHLLNDIATKAVDSMTSPLFNYDTKGEKMQHLPFITEGEIRSGIQYQPKPPEREKLPPEKDLIEPRTPIGTQPVKEFAKGSEMEQSLIRALDTWAEGQKAKSEREKEDWLKAHGATIESVEPKTAAAGTPAELTALRPKEPAVSFQPKREDFENPKTLGTALKSPGWAILTGTQELLGPGTHPSNEANNAALAKELKAKGYDAIPVKGIYKGIDQGKNFLVPGMTPEEAQAFGRKYKQESVLIPEGSLYNDNTVTPALADQLKIGPAAEKEDFYSTLPNGTSFSVPLDFESERKPLAGTEGQPIPEQSQLFGGRPEQLYTKGGRTKFVSPADLTRKELADRFPEAIVPPRTRNAKTGELEEPTIPSEITKSPLYKKSANPVKAFADKLVEEAKKAWSTPEGQSGLRWYSEFTPLLKKEFGKDHEVMAQLLAATSPQNPPTQNYAYALDALESFKRGRFDKILKKYAEGGKMVEDGTWKKWYDRHAAAPIKEPTPETFLAEWISKFDLQPRQTNGAKYGIASTAVLQVLAGDWLSKNRGPKVSNFVANLLGTGSRATVDLWHDRVFRRIGYEEKGRWRILPANKEGVSDEDFSFAQDATDEAAKELGIKASALQGLLWFNEKKLWADRGWGRADFGDFREEIKKTPLLRQGIEQRIREAKQKAKGKAVTQEEFGGLLEPRELK